ncbi:YibQ protein [Sulfitobacter noctilucae]|uniref:divergent polysaccharide deacteylase family protein n=1 Tax=Sulfitobacter noctilucae TaxID=1342302 RepID=UPI000469E60E|nr:divergent polysaccharide deacetylase family protein [Sulfitobacter noctilucae]KIN61321.1 YibQ protein [Sulfitobacter noctilucae]
MARGFLSGAVWGGIVSLGVGGVASVMAPLPEAPPSSEAPQVSDFTPPDVSSPDATLPSTPQEGGIAVTEPDTPPQQGQTAQQTAPGDADTLGTLTEPQLRLSPVTQPDVLGALDAPDGMPNSGALALADEEPVFPNPQALAPMIPQPADGVSIDTEPAETPQAGTPDPVEAQSDPAEAPSDSVEAPSDAAEPSAPDTAVADDTVPPAEDAPDQTPEPAPLDPPQVAQGASDPVDPPAAVSPPPAEQEDAPPQVAMLAPSARPQIGTPAVSLTDRSSGVIINRPTDEEEAAQTPGVTVITDSGAVAEAAAQGDVAPLVRNAEPFANPDNKPLMSVVLIDDGSTPTNGTAGIAALRSFPYTLSIAVDSALPDAAERMALYRTAGFEVLAMIDLPAGAQPLDVETTFGATLSQMREVVGVLEGPSGGLQPSRDVSDQVIAVLAQSGHGMVTQDKGLNTMPNLARKQGVLADPIFRDFDSKGQTAQVIRRFLDQAAFKAGQEGAVIMLGRMRPDTISALLLWGLQDRAGQVALAPISALLTRDGG